MIEIHTLLPQALADVRALLPAGTGLRKTGALLLLGGLSGVLLPGVPGWPLLIAAAAVFLSKSPRGSLLDRWLGQRFPVAQLRALTFLAVFLRDLNRRFPREGRDKPPGVRVLTSNAEQFQLTQ
jgi:hypothetical protein